MDAGVTATATATVPSRRRNLRDYVNSVNLPQGLIAMKKLERLKELQRRRDFSENFYSQAIRRLIGEHFFSESLAMEPVIGKRIVSPSNRFNGDHISAEPRMRAGGYSKVNHTKKSQNNYVNSLEPHMKTSWAWSKMEKNSKHKLEI